MGVHLAMLQLSVMYFAPFATFTFHDLVKFQMDKRARVQLVMVAMATTIALFAFGIKEEVRSGEERKARVGARSERHEERSDDTA